MVGNSLSMCICDILRGEVEEKYVQLIRCSFDPPSKYSDNPREFFIIHTLELYQKAYWYKNPQLGKEIALRLFDAGKLEFTGGHYLEERWGDVPLKLISECGGHYN